MKKNSFNMGYPKLEGQQPYGSIIIEIYKGNNTLSTIAYKLNKTKTTIKAQIEKLIEKKYINRIPINRDGKTIKDNLPTTEKIKRGGAEITKTTSYSFRYELNKSTFIEYWADLFKRIEKASKGKTAKGFDENLAEEKFDIWLNALTSFFVSTIGEDYPVTIDVIGHFFLSQQRLLEEMQKYGIGAFLDRPLSYLLRINTNENKILGKRFMKKKKKRFR